MTNSTVHVLLVEDNPGDARLIRELLRDVGQPTFEIECADHLSAGLARLVARRFDAVVLDLSLPDSKGIPTFVKAHEQAPDAPIVVWTGLDDEETAVQAVIAGAQDYLVKGQVQGSSLARAIRYAIERQRAEEEIRRLNASLEQRVAERTAQLAAVNKELETFAYSVSHDLRAPLRHLDGFVRLLVERTAGQLDETATRYAQTIRASAAKMARLIEDLLAFSRMGRAALRTQRVEITPLIAEVQQEIAPALRDRRVTWRIADLPAVEADPGLLRIVLTNLLANALKFSAPRPEARIEVGAAAGEAGEVVVYVRDNGVGFDMKYADKLFGVFQRLHSEEEFEGTGIGLATVRRIIDRHGGRVWAEGEPNGGATFYFSLKAADRK